MNVAAVRDGLATALQAIPNVQVSSYMLAQPSPPGLQIIPPSVVYDFAMQRGLDEWTFTVQGFVSLSTDIGAQKLLDKLCDPSGANSVKAALEADKTLGGAVERLRVLDQSPGRQVDVPGGNPMLLVEWRVQVFAKGV